MLYKSLVAISFAVYSDTGFEYWRDLIVRRSAIVPQKIPIIYYTNVSWSIIKVLYKSYRTWLVVFVTPIIVPGVRSFRRLSIAGVRVLSVIVCLHWWQVRLGVMILRAGMDFVITARLCALPRFWFSFIGLWAVLGWLWFGGSLSWRIVGLRPVVFLSPARWGAPFVLNRTTV